MRVQTNPIIMDDFRRQEASGGLRKRDARTERQGDGGRTEPGFIWLSVLIFAP